MGAINVKHTGSGAAIALSSDGTSLLLDGTAIGGGGGGADLYAANESSPAAQPSATGVNGIAIGDSALSSGVRGMSFGYSSTASGENSIALGNSTAAGDNSVTAGLYAETTSAASSGVAIGSSPIASGPKAVALGGSARGAGENSVAISNSNASGEYSLAAMITNNTTSYGAQGTNSVAIGKNAKCTNTGFAIGYMTQSTAAGSSVLGFGSIGSGNKSTALGTYAKSSGYGSVAISGEPSGYYTEASAQYSVAIGNRALSAITGKMAYAGRCFSDNGDAQQGTFVLLSDTTDATAEALTTNKSTAGTSNQVVLPNNSAYTFTAMVVAREKASEGTEAAAFKIEGLIRREANAGSTVLVASTATVLSNANGFAVAATANTTHGCLALTVTGKASTNIRWTATVTTTELSYA